MKIICQNGAKTYANAMSICKDKKRENLHLSVFIRSLVLICNG